MPPFIVLALPRSRSFWLSKFLSYGGWTCGHEELRHMRSLEDVKAWLSLPATGTAETAAAPWWRTLQTLAPQIRVVVVRRPPADVFDSLTRLDIAFDKAALRAELRHLDRKLDQITERWPGVLSIRFDDLAAEQTCAQVFEHCLPFKHDPPWWAALAALNLQIDMAAMMRYMAAYRPQLKKLAALAKQQTVAGMQPLGRADGATPDFDGVVIGEEDFGSYWRDGQHLMREHCLAVGEDEDEFRRMNIPLFEQINLDGKGCIVSARINGRMMGYITAFFSPSFKSKDEIYFVQMAFFVSSDAKRLNLPLRMQRAILDIAKRRGATKAIFRAGVNGEGNRFSSLYKRMGGSDFGQLYDLDLASWKH